MLGKLLNFRNLSIALAILLATTADLKLHRLLIDPFAEIHSGNSDALSIVASSCESSVVSRVFSRCESVVKQATLCIAFIVDWIHPGFPWEASRGSGVQLECTLLFVASR
jgi:hypothetical protein